jgi:hypothetical protein
MTKTIFVLMTWMDDEQELTSMRAYTSLVRAGSPGDGDT